MAGARRSMRWAAGALALVTASCADDAPVDRAAATTTTSEAPVVVPEGVLVAVPFQNRQDVPAQRFQTKLINGSDERLSVVGVQFVWSGLTSEVTARTAVIVPGQRIDLPLPLPAATCVGHGSEADMPSLADAEVRLLLDDGSERRLPVVDRDHVARRLYLDDCERQRIDAAVSIRWTDITASIVDGRPVSRGTLTLERRGAAGVVIVDSVGSTIVFAPEPVDSESPLRLEAGDDLAAAEFWFLESRCDPHALSEASQAFVFVVRVDLGDGVPLPYTVVPAAVDQGPMRATLTQGCDALGKIRPFDPDSGH